MLLATDSKALTPSSITLEVELITFPTSSIAYASSFASDLAFISASTYCFYWFSISA
jgi:hypothetical protein